MTPTVAARALPLASYKLRLRERHVRAVPTIDLTGDAFVAAGVDLFADDADRVIAAAAPLFSWLAAREPGVRIRSVSVRVEPPRVLVSLDPIVDPTDRPRALRFDSPFSDELREAGREAERLIGEACVRKLTLRAERA